MLIFEQHQRQQKQQHTSIKTFGLSLTVDVITSRCFNAMRFFRFVYFTLQFILSVHFFLLKLLLLFAVVLIALLIWTHKYVAIDVMLASSPNTQRLNRLNDLLQCLCVSLLKTIWSLHINFFVFHHNVHRSARRACIGRRKII